MKVCGIYFITCLANNKKYVGSSVHIHQRWKQHRHHLRKGRHANPHLQAAWNKYGEHNFSFEIAEIVSAFRLLQVEQEYLNSTKLHPRIYYNVARSVEHTTIGHKYSSKSKKKLSASRRKQWASGIYNKRQGAGFQKGFKPTKQHIENVREGLRHQNVLTFKNSVSGEVFCGRRCDFIKTHNLNSGKICRLVNGQKPQYKGWILCTRTI